MYVSFQSAVKQRKNDGMLTGRRGGTGGVVKIIIIIIIKSERNHNVIV